MWIPMASPYSLCKEALAHSITCLLSSLLTAPTQGTGSIVETLASSRNTSFCALTSMDDDSVAQASISTLGCRGNTMMAGHCQVPACCLSCLAWVFQGLGYTSEHLTLSSQDFVVSQSRAVVREVMFSTHPAGGCSQAGDGEPLTWRPNPDLA